MKKHIIFGGFDYAVRWEMDQDAVYRGIDYFVDNDPELVGTTYMGKPIYSPDKLLEEDKDKILILIGSIWVLRRISIINGRLDFAGTISARDCGSMWSGRIKVKTAAIF